MKGNAYRKAIQAKGRTETIHDVELPSGTIWKLREPNLQQFVLSGKLPAALLKKFTELAQHAKDGTNQNLLAGLDVEDLMMTLEFGRDLLLHCAVEPIISLNPKNDDEVTPEEIWPEDFKFLLNWLWSGGKSGASLETFRSE